MMQRSTSGMDGASGERLAIPGHRDTAEPARSSSSWRPDIFVQSFVPQSSLAINESRAVPMKAEAVKGTDFEDYIATFAGRGFLTVLPQPSIPRLLFPEKVRTLKNLSAETYAQHFQDCLCMDLTGHSHEISTFNLYGVPLRVHDPVSQIFVLDVPGLRENTPSAGLGDLLKLRQLITPDAYNYVYTPLSPEGWFPSPGGPPGFTGYEIQAVVLAVDKKNERLHLRAVGLINYPRLLCNVIFIKQTRAQSLYTAVEDIASSMSPHIEASVNPERKTHELNIDLRDDVKHMDSSHEVSGRESTPNLWVKSVLFPQETDGVMRRGLPSGNVAGPWYDDMLNYEQKKAVHAVRSADYGRLAFLINGPPGTGKTKTICEIVVQLARCYPDHGSILLCAPSNQAADTLALRLRKYFDPTAMFRLNHYSRTFAEIPEELLLYCFTSNDMFDLPPIATIMSYQIVVTTCQDADILVQARLTNRDLFHLQQQMAKTLNPRHPETTNSALHWATLIIDEAAQATEPETLIPLSVVIPPKTAHLKRQPLFVMAGDQHQLNPRTYDKSTTLHVSLFERLSSDPLYATHPLARRTLRKSSTDRNQTPYLIPPFINLIRNYRSHPAILAVPSSLFYHNTLIPETPYRITTPLSSWPGWRAPHRWPILFRCNAGADACEDPRSVRGGWYNTREAHLALAYAYDLLAGGHVATAQDICLMSPFRAQVRLLRQLARQYKPTPPPPPLTRTDTGDDLSERQPHRQQLRDLNIGPTDAFQGLESTFVILCTTRARVRFLADDRARGAGIVHDPPKMNVALTRAKAGLIVIGNPWVLGLDPCWGQVLGFLWRSRGWVFDGADGHGYNYDDRGTENGNSGIYEDPQMRGLQESDVNAWTPADCGDPASSAAPDPTGLEAALLYKESIDHGRPSPSSSSSAAAAAPPRRFLSLGARDDEQTGGGGAEEEPRFWQSGIDAEEALLQQQQEDREVD